VLVLDALVRMKVPAPEPSTPTSTFVCWQFAAASSIAHW